MIGDLGDWVFESAARSFAAKSTMDDTRLRVLVLLKISRNFVNVSVP